MKMVVSGDKQIVYVSEDGKDWLLYWGSANGPRGQFQLCYQPIVVQWGSQVSYEKGLESNFGWSRYLTEPWDPPVPIEGIYETEEEATKALIDLSLTILASGFAAIRMESLL